METPNPKPVIEEKTLNITDSNGAKAAIADIEIFGDGDTFKLICKASSKAQGWMKSTKAAVIPNKGCIVQVSTQQRNSDGSYAVAESVVFIEGVTVIDVKEKDGNTYPRIVKA